MYSNKVVDYGTPKRQSENTVTVHIDGKPVCVPEGTSVMRAATEAGVNVPKLCATDSLESFGSCRLCLVEIDGRRSCSLVTAAGDRLHVQVPDGTVTLTVAPRFVVPGSEAPTGGLVAPMPGVVIDLRAAVGDRVEAGQVLVVLEAMKMEHHIAAPFDGTVTEVPIAAGEQLENGALLLVIEPDGDADDGEGDG